VGNIPVSWFQLTSTDKKQPLAEVGPDFKSVLRLML